MLTVALHNAQELDNDLGGRADEHLALAATLGIDDVVEAVVLQKPSTCTKHTPRANSTHKNGYADHF